MIDVMMAILFNLILLACSGAKVVDRVPQITYYDCCSPSLKADAKWGCRIAPDLPRNMLIDENGDKHIFIWSDCKPGTERWREWEK